MNENIQQIYYCGKCSALVFKSHSCPHRSGVRCTTVFDNGQRCGYNGSSSPGTNYVPMDEVFRKILDGMKLKLSI